MKAYLSIFNKTLSVAFTYKSHIYLSFLSTLIFTMLQFSLWYAIYGMNSSDINADKFSDVIAYIFIGVLVRIATTANVSEQVSAEINTGNIELSLLRPYNFFGLCLSRHISGMVADFLMRGIVLLFICLLFFSKYMRIDLELNHILFFIVSLLNAMFLSFCVDYLIGLLAFWIIHTWQLKFLVRDLGNVLSGFFIPLWYFPPALLSVIDYLPFKYMYFVPINILLGKLPPHALVLQLIIGLAWSVFFSFVIFGMWNKLQKRVFIQGG